jgi:hypothetical protein
MDKIQEALIKSGRKDLAQEYYRKIARRKDDIIKMGCIWIERRHVVFDF